MKTYSRLQRRTHQDSDRLVANIQPRSVDDRSDQPLPSGVDFSHVDLFSNAPQRRAVQAKLTVGAPTDVYEQEANKVAKQVLEIPDFPAQNANPTAQKSPQDRSTAIAPSALKPLLPIQSASFGRIQRIEFEYASYAAQLGSFVSIPDNDATRWKKEFKELQDVADKLQGMSDLNQYLTSESDQQFKEIKEFIEKNKDKTVKASDRQSTGKLIGDHLNGANKILKGFSIAKLQFINSQIGTENNSVNNHYKKIWGNLPGEIISFRDRVQKLGNNTSQVDLDQALKDGGSLHQSVRTAAANEKQKDLTDQQNKPVKKEKQAVPTPTPPEPDFFNLGNTKQQNSSKQEKQPEPLEPPMTQDELLEEARQQIREMQRDPDQVEQDPENPYFKSLVGALCKVDRLQKGHDNPNQEKRKKANKSVEMLLGNIRDNYGKVSQIVPLPNDPLTWTALQAWEAIYGGKLDQFQVALNLNRTYQSSHDGENGIGGEYVPNGTSGTWVVHVHRGPNGGLKIASTKNWATRRAGMSSQKLTAEKAVDAGIPQTDATRQNHGQQVGVYG